MLTNESMTEMAVLMYLCSLCNTISMDLISIMEMNRRGLSSHKTREENPGYKVKFLFTIQTTALPGNETIRFRKHKLLFHRLLNTSPTNFY